MPTRRTTVTPDLPHDERAVLPDGRTLEPGTEFTVPGEGRFRFAYQWGPDRSLAAYGPVGKATAMMRAFRPDRVRTIHRKGVQT